MYRVSEKEQFPKHADSAPGRGTRLNPKNRFEEIEIVSEAEYAQSADWDESDRRVPTRWFEDRTKSILSKNDSPDIPFAYSVNPYRGCEHGCVYCYARPSHEYLGFSSGLDFETKILVKRDAARLLDRELQRRGWEPQTISFSGNTDCYQPAERVLRITRECLAVLLDHRNPVNIVTKNALVLRDLDILRKMAAFRLVTVSISLSTTDPALARILEPRTSAPAKRLKTIAALADAGIPSGILVAPVIPGLTDEEIPAVLRAAASSGAQYAFMEMLRLPYQVKSLFVDWLDRHFPDKMERILGRLREMRDGKLNDSAFGTRMTGTGAYADSIRALFVVSREKLGLSRNVPPLAVEHFRRMEKGQMGLFSS